MSGLAWASLYRLGVAGIGLTPEAFWSLTPAELATLAGLEPGRAPMGRDRLSALMAAYPDDPKTRPETEED